MTRDEQRAFIAKHAGKLTDVQMAEKLGGTPSRIRWLRERMGLQGTTPVWSDKEKAALAEMKAAAATNAQIAERLGRTINAVKNQLKALKLTGGDVRPRGGSVKAEVSAAPDAPDSSTPKFADHDLHLRLMAKAQIEEAKKRGRAA